MQITDGEPVCRRSVGSLANGFQHRYGFCRTVLPGMRRTVFKTVDAANTLTYFARKGWGRLSLQHAKSLLSGIFTYAKNIGVLDGVNPLQGTIIPRKAAAPAETHASTADEVVAILDVLRQALGGCRFDLSSAKNPYAINLWAKIYVKR